MMAKKLIKYDFFARRKRRIVRSVKAKSFDVIFCNTSTNGHILSAMQDLRVPVLTRIPELGRIMNLHNKYGGHVDKTIEHSDKFIAVSMAVKQNLIKRYAQIKSSSIELRYGSVPEIQIELYKSAKKKFYSTYNIDESKLIIGGIGGFTWRKGTDLFVQVAGKVLKNHSDKVHFLWVGGKIDSDYFEDISEDLLKLGITDCVTFTGNSDSPFDFISCFDLFLMTAREDPFPLVNLEVAQFGVPIVAFEKTGGTPELMENCGIETIPYCDVENFVQRVIDYIENEDRRIKDGNKIKEYVHENHLAKDNFKVIYEDLAALTE